MRRATTAGTGLLAVYLAMAAPQGNVRIELNKPGAIALAVADMRGTGAAQPVMSAFNTTLYDDLRGSGLFKLVPKGILPLNTPQQPSDFKGVTNPAAGGQGSAGYFLSDWSGPPAQANYLAFGYTAGQGGSLTLYGWLYNLTQSLQGAQVIGKRYFGDVSEAGARKIAHEFAADIIAQFGGTSLAGSHIYFVSDRTGTKEIWSMD